MPAFRQANDYFEGIADDDVPEYVLVSDFANFRLVNLDDPDRDPPEFPVSAENRRKTCGRQREPFI